MKKGKLFTGILLFGSLWGFAECVISPMLGRAGLPSGVILTGVVAFGLMAASRVVYRIPGMQLGMGLVAGAMRLLNPFGGCHLCSAIAIMAEGAVFELIWLGVSSQTVESMPLKIKASLGIVTSYGVYVIGYLVTQVLTPVFSSAGFYLSNLVVFIPQILASGLLAAVLGGLTAPLAFSAREFNVSTLANRVYYPLSIGVSALCWAVVILNANVIAGL